MPGVLSASASDPESSQKEKLKPEFVKLWLPSQLEDATKRTSLCAAVRATLPLTLLVS